MKQRTIIIVLEYDGTDFAGWQIQPGERTVQRELEFALKRLTGKPAKTTAAGRTDAGVHALGQVVSVKTSSPIQIRAFGAGLNSMLPPDIVVREAREAEASFDARRAAKGKVYRYELLNRRERTALDRSRVWLQREPMDVKAMREAAKILVGEHDFKTFRGKHCASKTTIRNITRVDVTKTGDRVSIEVEGTAFLKHMVRNIVGTLIEVGRGKWPPERVGDALRAKDRTKAGQTAPAHGLYLVKVIY